jgi:hypothetical protein
MQFICTRCETGLKSSTGSTIYLQTMYVYCLYTLWILLNRAYSWSYFTISVCLKSGLIRGMGVALYRGDYWKERFNSDGNKFHQYQQNDIPECDIVSIFQVIKTTGFMKGLFTEAEMNSENVKVGKFITLWHHWDTHFSYMYACMYIVCMSSIFGQKTLILFLFILIGILDLSCIYHSLTTTTAPLDL